MNDRHLPDVAAAMAPLGVDVMNCIGMIPAAGTPFETLPGPTHEELAQLRAATGEHLPQMKHCQRCRADAVGLLEEDRSGEFRACLSGCARTVELRTERPHVAVATSGGGVVNEHLGEADSFEIWESVGGEPRLRETRPVPALAGGVDRWRALASLLSDCRAVLVSGVGPVPRAVLEDADAVPVEVTGRVEVALKAVYADVAALELPRRRVRSHCAKGVGCRGDGRGCG